MENETAADRTGGVIRKLKLNLWDLRWWSAAQLTAGGWVLRRLAPVSGNLLPARGCIWAACTVDVPRPCSGGRVSSVALVSAGGDKKK